MQKWFKCPCMHMCCRFSHVWLFGTLGTVTHQAPLPMGFSGQEYWSQLPLPPAGDLPDPGIKPESLMSPAFSGSFFTTSTTWEALQMISEWINKTWSWNTIEYCSEWQTKSKITFFFFCCCSWLAGSTLVPWLCSFLYPHIESAGVLTAGSPGNPQENFRVMKLLQMLILDYHNGWTTHKFT